MVPRLRTVAILLVLAGLALGVFTSRALRALRPGDLLGDPTLGNSPQVEQLVENYQRAYQLDAREADAIRQELKRYDRRVRDLVWELRQANADRFDGLLQESTDRIRELLTDDERAD